MLGLGANIDVVVVDTNRVVHLQVHLVHVGEHQQLGLVMAQRDPIFPAIVLDEGKDVEEIGELVSSQHRVICEPHSRNYLGFGSVLGF